MRLVSVQPAHDGKHKFVAHFEDNNRDFTTKFGAAGMDDYLITHSKTQRDRYRQRHQKDLETGDPTRAGFLSMWLLWGPSRSLSKNIKNYKSHFGM